MRKMANTIKRLRAEGIVGCAFEVDEVRWGNDRTFGWAGHAAIRMQLVDGTNIYLDDGYLGGADHVFMDDEVPSYYSRSHGPAKPHFIPGEGPREKCRASGKSCLAHLCD